MKISVIIPTKDRFDDVQKCLDSISKQTLKPSEVIIVDASDKQGLQKILEQKYENVTYIHAKPGLTYQRNVGVKNACGDLIAFFDDDVILDKNYFNEIVRFFSDDTQKIIGGVTGKIVNQTKMKFLSTLYRSLFCLSVVSKGEVKPSWSNNAISDKISKPIKVDWLQGANQIYRREVFENNLFDEALKGYCYMEDVDFSYRVKKQYEIYYLPQAKCVHNHKSSPTTRMKKREKQQMFMVNYHYLFKKNIKQSFKNIFCHYWSFLGFIVRGLFFERSMDFTLGTIKGIFINILGRNPLIKR